MFKNLPRQTFGRVQSKLFPIYFGLSSACSAIQLGVLLFGAAAAPQKQLVLLGENRGAAAWPAMATLASARPLPAGTKCTYSACPPSLPCSAHTRRLGPGLLPALFPGGGAALHPHHVPVSRGADAISLDCPLRLQPAACCCYPVCMVPETATAGRTADSLVCTITAAGNGGKC